MNDLTARPGRTALCGLGAFGLIALLFYVAWPVGVTVALLIGIVVVAAMGRRMQRIENAKPHDGVLDLSLLAPVEDPQVDEQQVDAQQVDGPRITAAALEEELGGEEFLDFRRAATLVVAEQYASAARLQRGLHVSYTRARRLLAELEEQHLVSAADGTKPRAVLVERERLTDLELLLADA